MDCREVTNPRTGQTWWEAESIAVAIMPSTERRTTIDDEDTTEGVVMSLGRAGAGVVYLLESKRWDGVGTWRRVIVK